MSTDLEQQARELVEQLFNSQGARIAAFPVIRRALQRVQTAAAAAAGAEDTKELRDRFVHFFGRTDGTFDFPNTLEGDLLKMSAKALGIECPAVGSLRATKEREGM